MAATVERFGVDEVLAGVLQAEVLEEERNVRAKGRAPQSATRKRRYRDRPETINELAPKVPWSARRLVPQATLAPAPTCSP